MRRRAKGVDVLGVSCEPAARTATKPALFLAGSRDVLAAPATHARPLEALYGGPSTLLVFDGEHNSPRPRWVYDRVRAFLEAAFSDDDPGAAAAALAAAAANAVPVPVGSEAAVALVASTDAL